MEETVRLLACMHERERKSFLNLLLFYFLKPNTKVDGKSVFLSLNPKDVLLYILLCISLIPYTYIHTYT